MAHILPKKIPPRFVWKFKSRTWSVAEWNRDWWWSPKLRLLYICWTKLSSLPEFPCCLLHYSYTWFWKVTPIRSHKGPRLNKDTKHSAIPRNHPQWMDGWMFPIHEKIWLTKLCLGLSDLARIWEHQIYLQLKKSWKKVEKKLIWEIPKYSKKKLKKSWPEEKPLKTEKICGFPQNQPNFNMFSTFFQLFFNFYDLIL